MTHVAMRTLGALVAVLATGRITERPARAVANDNRAPAGPLRDGVLTVRLEARESEWHPDGDAMHLKVPAYRTARGTDIDAQSWRLVRGDDGLWRARRNA